ncbi:MAG: serine/threonine-protein phosphatase [Bacteroidales bacterium]|nr:serine/threonine-protein phosphatase [Bacteroidales bacterium]
MLQSLKKLFLAGGVKAIETSSIQGRKPAQEDSFYVSEIKYGRRLVFVADGVGGHGHGDFASQKTVEIFDYEFNRMAEDESVTDFLRKTTLKAANQVLNKCKEDESYKNCGTTISGFMISGNAYYTINVGDSRVYLWNDGVLSRETHDHSIVQQLLDSGQINEEEAFTHPKRNMMTSAIGQDLQMMKVDISDPKPLVAGDVLMAFSDGVHDALTDNQIFQIVKKMKSSNGLAEELTSQAYNAGGKDNITAVIFRYLG